MATAVSLARGDLAQQVPQRERAGEAHHWPLLDEFRGGVQRLIDGLAPLLEHLLRVFGVEIAEDLRGRALSVRTLWFGCHGGYPPCREPRHRPCPRLPP